MQYRKLGQTGIDVSVICLGTMTFGEQNSEAEAHAQLDYALAHGVNFIDTAEMYPVPPCRETYTRTEQYLGSWLKRRGKPAHRLPRPLPVALAGAARQLLRPPRHERAG